MQEFLNVLEVGRNIFSESAVAFETVLEISISVVFIFLSFLVFFV